MRFQAFKDNLKSIESHDIDEHGFEVGLNEMSDWTEDEYKMISGQIHRPKRMEKRVQTGEKRLPTGNLASSIDWVKAGMVGPSRTQGSCGSCWAFTTSACLESYYKIANPNNKIP